MNPNNRPALPFSVLKRVLAGNRVGALVSQTANTGENASQQNVPTPPISSSTATTSASCATPHANNSALTKPALQMIEVSESCNLNQISSEHLQCPVCLDTIRTKPIFQCPNGHAICSTCIPQLDRCPLCRDCLSFGNEKIRNTVLETLMEHVQVACPYRSKGCLHTAKGMLLKEHVLECVYGRFNLCPALGFDTCKEPLHCENWAVHITEMHKLAVYPAKHENVIITYSDFLSTNTVNKDCRINWESIVLTPFPDAGHFLIMCELDILKNCTATFSCIHAQRKSIVDDDDPDANDDSLQEYIVEFTIGDQSSFTDVSWMPNRITWTVEPMLYSEYKNGSTKGVHKIPLAQYCTSNDSSTGAVALPLQNNHAVQNVNRAHSPAHANNGRTTDEDKVLLPPRQLSSSIKRDLTVKVRFAKSLRELRLPSCSSETSLGSITITKYTIPTFAASYRFSKCDHCRNGPLRGIRFRCMECPRYDLCYDCMTENELHTHHYFAFIQNPDQDRRMKNNFKRIFRQGPEKDSEVGDSAEQDENQTIVFSSKRPRMTPTNTCSMINTTAVVGSSSLSTHTANIFSSEATNAPSSLPLMAPPS